MKFGASIKQIKQITTYLANWLVMPSTYNK